MNDLIFPELSENEKLVAEAAVMGLTNKAIAARVSLTPATVSKYLKKPAVQNYMQQMHNAHNDLIAVTKPRVVEMLLDAVEEAKLLADPGVQIKGLREIGLMMGFYAPEERKLTITKEAEITKQRLSGMSDADLMELAGSNVIEGDFTRET